MADFPLLGAQRYLAAANATTTIGHALTPNATAHTKGSYTALFTAAGNIGGASGVLVALNPAQPSVDYLVDLAVGAAASETVVVDNLLASNSGDAPNACYLLPLAIQNGIRVAARCQASAASSATCYVTLHLYQQGLAPSQPGSRASSYGLATGTTRGTQVDPGGTVNTKGAWSQLTASTANDVASLTVGIGGTQNTARVAANWLVDIGIGASGSEVVLIPNLYVVGAGTSFLTPGAFPALPANIPSGTAISARAQCSINDATDRLLDVAAYGIG